MAELLTASLSDNEGGTTDWVVSTGSVTIANSTDYAYTGTKSLKATAGAAAYFMLESPLLTFDPSSTSINVAMQVRASQVRWVTIVVNWYDTSNGYISWDEVEQKNASTSAWGLYSGTVTPPSGAVKALVSITCHPSASGEAFYFDTASVDDGVGTHATPTPLEIVTGTGIPAVGVLTGANTTATPDTIPTTTAVGPLAHVGTESTTVTPTVIATTTVVHTPSAVAESSAATPATIATTTTVHPIAVATTAATVVAQTIQTATTVASYAARLSHTVQPPTTATTAAVFAPNTNETAPPAMTTIAASITIPAPTISTSSGAGISTGTATITSSVTIPTPTISALSAATSLVVRDLIAMTRRQLHTFHQPQYNLLSAPGLNAGTRTIRFQYPLQGITTGSLISIDDELIYVLHAAPSALEIEGLRGAEGTSPADHAADALVEVGIRYPTVEIRRALADEIRSWPTGIFRDGHVDLTVGHGITSVDLAGVPPEFTRILDVRRAPFPGSCDEDWTRVSFRVDRNANPSSFASGAALTFPHGLGGATTIRVSYAAPFVTTDMADEVQLMEQIGLSDTLLDVAQLGALWRLVLPREIRRADLDVQGQPRRAEEVPAGHNAQTARQMKTIRDERLRDEAKRLLTKYPMRMAS